MTGFSEQLKKFTSRPKEKEEAHPARMKRTWYADMKFPNFSGGELF
jgi:hypothetical protein